MAAAAIGAGATVGGNAMNAVGQERAAEALQHIWEDQRRRQAAQDARLQAATQQLIGGAGQAFDPAAHGALQAPIQQKLDATAANTANAVAANLNRKSTPAETRALISSGIAGDADAARRNAALISQLQAYGLGLRHLDMLGREFALQRGHIGADAADQARLLPLAQQVAGMAGIGLRTAGTTISGLGQGLMYNAMSKPRPSGGGDVGVTTAPPSDTVITPEGATGTGYDWIGRPVWQGAS